MLEGVTTIFRAVALLCALGGPLFAQDATGKVFDKELAPRRKGGDPLVYAVYLARSYTSRKPAPLILAIHAGRGTAHRFASFLMPLAEAQGAVLVCPQGIEEIIGAEGYWWKGNKSEMVAIDRLLAAVRKHYRLDAKRFTLVGLADGAELGMRWALAKDRGLKGLIALNFLWKPPGSLRAPKTLKVCLVACRKAKEKSILLKDEAEKARKALERSKYPVVLRIMPGASRSFFFGWERTFRKAYAWFNGKLDWPAELAKPPAPPKAR